MALRRVDRSTWPWYRLHPDRSAAVTVASFAVISVLCVVDNRAADATALLYVLPIALAAVTFDLVGGLVAATVAFALFAAIRLLDPSGSLDAVGWVVRGVAMASIGGLLGQANAQVRKKERAVAAEGRRRSELEQVNRSFADGIKAGDALLQGVAAAKWMVEQGRTAEAADLLMTVLTAGCEEVSPLLRLASSPAGRSDDGAAPAGGG